MIKVVAMKERTQAMMNKEIKTREAEGLRILTILDPEFFSVICSYQQSTFFT